MFQPSRSTTPLRATALALIGLLFITFGCTGCTAHDDRFGTGPSVVVDRSMPVEQLEPLQMRVFTGSTIIGVQGPGWQDPRVAIVVESPMQARWPLLVRIPWQEAQRLASEMTREFPGGPPIDRGLQPPVVLRLTDGDTGEMAIVRIESDAVVTVEAQRRLGSNRVYVEADGLVVAAVDLSPSASWEFAQALRRAAAVQP